jgi:alpha-mannosidase
MAKRKTGGGRRRPTSRAGRVRCFVVSNTHWDREWKHSAQHTRFLLVQMMDTLLDILEREPAYRSFHLDSQTLPLLDYLEIRPEREAVIREHVRTGRLVIGPWFCLPDEFSVAGESLVRNLLLGHRVARRFGAVAKTGYSPFSWGQCSQMPQLYAGFGIDVMMFYRGVNTRVAPRSEFLWRGPDGTEIVASRLGARPRYNVWYVLQRPAYWGVPLDRLNEFETCWSTGQAPFRMIDADHARSEYRLAHPRYAYDASGLSEAAALALSEQDADWSQPNRFWSIGHDGSFPDAREVRLIADAKAALKDRADVAHSTILAFQRALSRARRRNWPRVTGEMRHTYTKGSTSRLLGWITSARLHLKQDNFRTEQWLYGLAEPLAASAAMLGAPYPRGSFDVAQRWLLENHCHDSIGGCGRDVVHDDMVYRFRQAREISRCIVDESLRAIAGAVDLNHLPATDVAVVVFNPTAARRSAVLPVVLDIPAEWSTGGFEVVDQRGRPVDVQLLEREDRFQERVHHPNEVFTYLTVARHHARLAVPEVPPVGYTTLHVRPADPTPPRSAATLRDGTHGMANAHLALTINANGTLDLVHKATGAAYRGLGYFRDSGAVGNPWEHRAPARDEECTTLEAPARVTLLHDGPLECAFRVELNWELPATSDEQGRSARRVSFPIVSDIVLRCDQPWVEITTSLENTARDHYLRVSFPTGRQTDVVHVQSPFDVVTRSFRTPDRRLFDDDPQAEQPMRSFLDVSDGQAGLALLSDGSKAYEAHDDAARTVSLTLLRAFALRFYVPDKADFPEDSAGSQCPGRHVFRYALMPHAGDWAAADVWSAATRFTTPLLAGQIGPTPHGEQPWSRSFLEIEPAGLQLCALKQGEQGRRWIVRLVNPLERAVRGRVRLNGGSASVPARQSPVERVETEFALPKARARRWRTVRQVTLEEKPVRKLAMDQAGWVRLGVPRKKIITLAFEA